MTTVPTQASYPAHEDAPGTDHRQPPYDPKAEQAVLGGMLLSKEAITDVVEALAPQGPDAFHEPAHETIYRVILDLYARDAAVDPITVANELTRRDEIRKVGGFSYLQTLVGAVPTSANAGYYAEIVSEKATFRRLVEAGTRIQMLGYSALGDASTAQDQASAEIARITQHDDRTTGAPLVDVFQDTIQEAEQIQNHGEPTGLLTGYTDLDSLTNGLQPEQMIIIAGRPSLGKSTLAVDIARHAAIRGGKIVEFFSLEMSRKELGQRIISAEAKVALHHLRSGTMTEGDWQRIAEQSGAITAAPLTIHDTPRMTITQIKAVCRRRQQRDGLDLVVIDYLQLMEVSGRRAESRQVEVSQLSHDIKVMAKELQVPVVVLCQLNRGPEQRVDKRPVASDLRESGALEQDADMVILLHREDAYEKESPRAGEVDLIVAKHRNGSTATITLANQLHYSRFVDQGPQ